MTAEEAIERINEHIAIHQYNEPHAIRILEALQMGIDALEKQIPRKPKYKAEDRFVKNHFAEYSYCPTCEKEVVAGDMFCVMCGQRICWQEEET